MFILPEDKIYFASVRGHKFSHPKAMAGEGSTDLPGEETALDAAALAAKLRENPSPETFKSAIAYLAKLPSKSGIAQRVVSSGAPPASDPDEVEFSLMDLFFALHLQDQTGVEQPEAGERKELTRRYVAASRSGGRRRRNYKFDRCVKTVRKTVKARKGSNKESAAIAICVTSVLHPKGRTMKRYRKGRLLTQKRK